MLCLVALIACGLCWLLFVTLAVVGLVDCFGHWWVSVDLVFNLFGFNNSLQRCGLFGGCCFARFSFMLLVVLLMCAALVMFRLCCLG